MDKVKNWLPSSMRVSYFSTLLTAFELNAKLVKLIFENIDTLRKTNNEFSQLAAQKRAILQAYNTRKSWIQTFALQALKLCLKPWL